MALLLRAVLEPPEITEEIERRFAPLHEATAPDFDTVTAVATKGDIGLSGELMARMPALKMIAVYGVGTDAIDLRQAAQRGIEVTTTPGVLTDAVAELAIGMTICGSRRIAEGDRFVRAGQWGNAKLGLGKASVGKTVGIFGYGRIGRRIAQFARGLDMSVLYCDLAPAKGEEDGYRKTAEALARDSDVMILAAAGGPGTRRLVDRNVLKALGRGGLLVNVARGSLVDEDDLLQALTAGEIGGAALDVFDNEPTIRPELLDHPNVTVSPHIASATREARVAMGQLVIENLSAFFEGRPLLTPLELPEP